MERGRVVKEKRKPVRSAPKMGANGIALIEYLGHVNVAHEYTVTDADGNEKSYWFSSRPAHRTQFIDKLHASDLIKRQDGDGTDLFRIIAQYATAAQKRKQRLELKLPADNEPPDDLPSGFAGEAWQ